MERTLASQESELGRVSYVCSVSAWVPGKDAIWTDGCRYRTSLRLTAPSSGSTTDGEAVLAAGPYAQKCKDAREACVREKGSMVLRIDADAVAVVTSAGPADRTLHSLYVARGIRRPIRWNDESGGTSQAILAAMPSLEDAIGARLTGRASPPKLETLDSVSVEDYDGLWEALREPARMKRHAAEVAPLVRSCKAPESASANFHQALGADGTSALYTGCKACGSGCSYLAKEKPPELLALLSADLRPIDPQAAVLPAGERQTLALAKAAALPGTGPLLDRRLTDIGLDNADHGRWFQAADALFAVDAGLATPHALARLAAVPATVDETSAPEPTFRITDGYLGHDALYAAILLLPHDTPRGRDGLAKIATDLRMSPASRKMAILLLRTWGDARGAGVTDIALSPLQAAAAARTTK